MHSSQNSSFSDLSLHPSLSLVLKELSYTTPTPIQQQSIPLLLSGKDLIGQAQTGSGKTAAFALPILQNLILRQRQIQALVLCPTRELCAQVAREIRKLGRRHPGLQVLIISGGAPIGPQLGALEKGVHIVVGTPGRVIDHLNRRSLDLSCTRTVVLDEADRMLEMGFQEDMEEILSKTPSQRQTVLFSATFPKTIEALSRTYQNTPVRVTVEEEARATPAIDQLAFEVEASNKLKTLFWIIEQYKIQSIIIFCNFKATVIQLLEELSQYSMSAGALHGDLEQRDRDRIMAQFRNGSIQILVATDVAARGIDVPSLDAVVNFELPSQPEIYVHRIGRTGRAGKKGLAFSFFSRREEAKIQSIERTIKTELLRETPPCFEKVEITSLQERIEGKAAMQTLFISGGRKEKMRPGDILGALTGEAGGLPAKDIGKIEIHDHFSYVALSRDLAPAAMEALRNGRIKGRKFRIELVSSH